MARPSSYRPNTPGSLSLRWQFVYGLLGITLFSTVAANELQAFLTRHWQTPLAAQGTLPMAPDRKAHALSAQDCGRCHTTQFEDWQSSRHGAAMGAGTLAQLVASDPDDRADHQACLRCHAALAEQADAFAAALRGGTLDKGLHARGLICASCHLRNGVWHGPARRDGTSPGQGDELVHRGWSVQPAFSDSRFCSTCHQFEPNGFALNGKLLENTYAEWAASRFAQEGVSCQSCHMPDRRHLWRGIHDPDMVRGGITIQAPPPRMSANVARASMTIHNTGTGHDFPTYVTPAVVVEFFQVDANNAVIPNTLREHVIARMVPLDLSSEQFDTRIRASGQSVFEYREPRASNAMGIARRLRVEPDAFYQRFYTAMLDSQLEARERLLYEQALREANASKFTVFYRYDPLP